MSTATLAARTHSYANAIDHALDYAAEDEMATTAVRMEGKKAYQ